MRSSLCALIIIGVTTPFLAAQRDALALARLLYNKGQYEEAIAEAQTARNNPGSSAAASLVLGRALLERYRQKQDPEDLTAAHGALRAVDPSQITARDHIELVIGLGEALYFEESFGAAAEMFDSVLDRASDIGASARERVLDWWATAIDRQSQGRSLAERSALYSRVLTRMEQELHKDPASAVASYWLPAAARGVGDTERAWDAAIAAWIRAALARDRAASLRADLDRLVLFGIIPERARRSTASSRMPSNTIESLTADWEQIKAMWGKQD